MYHASVKHPPPPPAMDPQPVQPSPLQHSHNNVWALLACSAMLAPLMGFGLAWSAPMYLLVSPLGVHVILNFHRQSGAHHVMQGFCMATLAFVFGSLAAVCICIFPRIPPHPSVYPIATAGIIIGTGQLILVLNKQDIIRVMLCTSCAVLIVVLACTALLVSETLAPLCYRSTSIPLLFLFWQTMTPHKIVNVSPV